MDRWESLYTFWSSFGVPVYEENSVPLGTPFPYITYEAAVAAFDEDTTLHASIWTRSTSWLEADTIANAIQADLKDGGVVVPYDGGIVWFTLEIPFAQSMGDPGDDFIKRKQLMVTAHFL